MGMAMIATEEYKELILAKEKLENIKCEVEKKSTLVDLTNFTELYFPGSCEFIKDFFGDEYENWLKKKIEERENNGTTE